MKRAYNYVKSEDVTACKELIRTMIKRDMKRYTCHLNEDDAQHYAYKATQFFDCMQCDFRADIEKWALKEIRKLEAVY